MTRGKRRDTVFVRGGGFYRKGAMKVTGLEMTSGGESGADADDVRCCRGRQASSKWLGCVESLHENTERTQGTEESCRYATLLKPYQGSGILRSAC